MTTANLLKKILFLTPGECPQSDFTRLQGQFNVKIIEQSDTATRDIMYFFNAGYDIVFLNVLKFRDYYTQNFNSLPDNLPVYYKGRFNEAKSEKLQKILDFDAWVEKLPLAFKTLEELIQKLSGHIPDNLFDSGPTSIVGKIIAVIKKLVSCARSVA